MLIFNSQRFAEIFIFFRLRTCFFKKNRTSVLKHRTTEHRGREGEHEQVTMCCLETTVYFSPVIDLVVTSALTSADVSLTSGSRSPDETDGAAGSVTHSIFVRFTSNFVHLHSLPPLQERVMSRFSLINFFLPKFLLDVNLENTDGKGNAT